VSILAEEFNPPVFGAQVVFEPARTADPLPDLTHVRGPSQNGPVDVPHLLTHMTATKPLK